MIFFWEFRLRHDVMRDHTLWFIVFSSVHDTFTNGHLGKFQKSPRLGLDFTRLSRLGLVWSCSRWYVTLRLSVIRALRYDTIRVWLLHLTRFNEWHLEKSHDLTRMIKIQPDTLSYLFFWDRTISLLNARFVLAYDHHYSERWINQFNSTLFRYNTIRYGDIDLTIYCSWSC